MAGPQTNASASVGGRWLRRLAVVLGAFALLVLLAWLAVPPIARSQIETRLAQGLGRPTTVERVTFDPFHLELDVHNVVVADPPRSSPLIAVDTLQTRLSLASIWHRGVVLDPVRIVGPRVSLSRDGDGRLNVQDLVDAASTASSGDPRRFSLNNIEIHKGAVEFDDAPVQARHRIADLEIALPFLSTLPYDAKAWVTPRIAGTANGSHFAFEGSTLPFAKPREATLDVVVDALPLPSYVRYLPDQPLFDPAGGRLTAHLVFAFVEAGAGGDPRLEMRGEARVDGFEIRRRDGSPLVSAERFEVGFERVDLVGRSASVQSIAIDHPRAELRRLADGSLEVARPLFTGKHPRASDTKTTEAQRWRVDIARLAMGRGAVSLVDESTGFRSDLVDVALEAKDLSTESGRKAHVSVSFMSADRIASFAGEADLEPTVPAATGQFKLAGFSLGLLFPFYQSALAVDVQRGSLDYASAFALDRDGRLTLTGGEAKVTDLRLAVPGNRQPLWQVPEISAGEISVDVPSRKVVLGNAQVRGATLRVVRESNGAFETSRLLKRVPSSRSASGDDDWVLLARSLGLDGVAVDFEDRATKPAVRLQVRELKASITDIGNGHAVKAGVDMRARVGSRGRLAFNGTLVTNPWSMQGKVDATALALNTVKPYVEPMVNIVLVDGTLAAKGVVTIETRDARPARASWKGDVTVTDFASLDRPTSSDLARWKSLRLEGLDYGSEQARASVARIALSDFFARVIVYPDATINLARLVTPGASPEPEPAPAPGVLADNAAATPAASPAIEFAIGRIEVERGNVNFSDLFVQPNYSANLTDVSGSISTMSRTQAGEVAIAARVDRTAPVEVSGTINPFAPQLLLDLKGTARDVDLPPLTMYSAKYAGYGIEKGKLSFDVHYRVENRKLSAENRLVLDQLTFGRRVESPTATKLPVLLAVALLKDRRGVIDVRLPISGSLDDPKFSMGGLIVQMIVNVIVKAVTAPFALLAAAFGGGEELSMIEFAAGSAVLDAEAQKRIDVLAKALSDRPGLKVDIAGRADPSADREALRHAWVDTALRREKMKALTRTGEAPPSLDQVEIKTDERTRWLTAAYREAPLPERPRNVFGLLKEVPPEEMERMLYGHAKVDDEALRGLANARAQAVKDSIAAKGVAADRLFLIAPRLGADAATDSASARGKPAAGATSRVDLALR